MQEDLANIERVYFGSGGHFWVTTIEDDDENEVVVGIVGLEGKPGNQAELRRMSVHASYRRYGVGRLLVACLEDWARAHSFNTVFLSSGSPMVQAHRFYKALGYQHTKTEVFPTVEMFTFEKEL